MRRRYVPQPKGEKFQSKPAGKSPTTPRKVKQAAKPGSLETRPRAVIKKAESKPVIEPVRAPRGDFKARTVQHERTPQAPLTSTSKWQP